MAAIDVQHFRDNVKSLCAERGMVAQLAKNAKISRPYLSDIMRGESVPSLDVAINIARALGVAVDTLILPPKKFSKNFSKAG